MAFNESIKQLTPSTRNHSSNFNEVYNQLLENTLDNRENKVGKEQIKNTLTETEIGNVLDATQGKVLNDKINVLDGVGFKYNGNITTFSQINKTGYYTIFGCLDGTIPIQYGTLKAYLSGSEKTITAMGWYNNEIIQCFASYNNNTSKWTWQQLATTTDTTVLSDKIDALEGDKLNNTSITLTRIESTSDQAIYTCPVDLELNRIYTFGTGSSPSGTVQTIILRCNLGDYIFKISNTNVVDAMQNATWGDFNAGTKVSVFLAERNGVKGAVIMSPSYSTSYFATTTKINVLPNKIKKLNNEDNWNAGNTTPKDYLNVMKPNGARTYNDLGISVNDGYWCNVFGINNYNGDTGVTELAFTDKGKIFFRTQVGVAKMENWNDTHWQQLATTTKTDILAKLKNNWTLRGGFYASKVYKNGNHISGNLTISGGIYTAGTIIIEQLPWKPNVNMQFPCSRYNARTASWESIVGEVDVAGNVKCSAGWKANDHIVLHLEYDIEG